MMRIAIVHDALIQFGGAERVLLALMEQYPHAPVYTLLYDKAVAPVLAAASDAFDERRIRTSFLQRIPGAAKRHHLFPLLMPMASEHFDLRGYDVVISDSYSYAKGVITGSETMHISYCFTPTRYLWDNSHQYVRDFMRVNRLLRLAPLGLSYVRLWDYFAAQRADVYITLSSFVASRIRKYYGREAVVVPPPVDVERFLVREDNDGYYLVVSRLVPYKRVDLAVSVCEQLQRPLKVVGTGPELARLQAGAGSMTEFLGFVPDHDLPAIYAGARALLFPQEEDFGITPLEAAAAGKPTIAYAAGGALETIHEPVTGLFFSEQSVSSLREAIERFEAVSFNVGKIRRQAERFSKKAFVTAFDAQLQAAWKTYRQRYQTRI